eukprot:CAMPEP_0117596384 /NCGR_PEP_ID=MMETSP0784-20121206/74282_1 /TAXON_ID=39447 /ORGANISM="" /LENGTH=72 /DNA_ID=CAMNT_0005398659 /DNA_START=93 /DNA_END=308 /DNA_ORIENTATION=+
MALALSMFKVVILQLGTYASTEELVACGDELGKLPQCISSPSMLQLRKAGGPENALEADEDDDTEPLPVATC